MNKLLQILTDEEKAKQFFKLSVAFAAGSIVTSMLSARDFKKRTEKLKQRNNMMQTYREEIRRIMDDITLSADERESKVDEIIKFVNLILDQPID